MNIKSKYHIFSTILSALCIQNINTHKNIYIIAHREYKIIVCAKIIYSYMLEKQIFVISVYEMHSKICIIYALEIVSREDKQ